LFLAIGAVVLSAYSGASSSQGNHPKQPIEFPHSRHAGAVKDGGLGLNCLYCHNTANKSPDAGLPAVGTCMGCHTTVAAAKPEIVKLAAYYNKGQPVPWVRVHKVPEYVHFPHVRHVNAGVTCQSCHGQVQKMGTATQVASLNMGWCVNCHVNGYDPKDGQKAAGYDSVPAAGYNHGVPFGTANSRAGIGTTPPGMGIPADPTQRGPRGLNEPTPSAERRRARYDCASCHY
jgi:hypothetical protein